MKQQLAKCCIRLVYTHPMIYLMHLKFDLFIVIWFQPNKHCYKYCNIFLPSSTIDSPLKILSLFEIFNVRFHNFHLFLLKANMKSAQRFLYTFSVHASIFITLKRNSNLYYSITTQTGQPPKGFGLEIVSEPADRLWTSFRSSLTAAVQILVLIMALLASMYAWHSFLSSVS